ncbi:hypothetical protein JTB14_038368 [Gonioctena quinquepunctata]|nr:hypothetical protein JTB14_038368 [Gonioctena quinquepunctata]
MPQCYVTSCSNYYGKTRGIGKIIYHMLPTSPEMAAKWSKLCGYKNEIPPPYARICSDHFSPNCYQRDLQHELLGLPLRKKLKHNTVPDRNLPGKNAKIMKQELKKVVEKEQRVENAEEKKTRIQKQPHTENLKHPLAQKQYVFIGRTNCGNDSVHNNEPNSISDLHSQVLKNKNNVQQAKNNNKLNRRPMRSSIRIAKKKSIELLSDSFTSKVNSKKERCSTKPERFSDKLKFMAKLQLKYERNTNFVIDLDSFFEKIVEDGETSSDVR